jgi:hypothetical protein
MHISRRRSTSLMPGNKELTRDSQRLADNAARRMKITFKMM